MQSIGKPREPPPAGSDFPFLSELVALRREIHAHPELAFHEHRTAGLVARELARYGLVVHRGLAKTGVVGLLKAGTRDRMIGLRADMDALPLTECNDFAHASTVPGCMHACGHDGHTAMLLGAARHLAAHPRFDGTVAFIFQPAEESEGGAKVMIEDGLFRKFPVEAVYGLHNWPGLPAGKMAVRSGPVMASTNRFEIAVHGRGGHAAMPHLATDAIVAGSSLVGALQTIVARTLHPAEAAVVSVTQFHAGSAWNILPETAHIQGTIRTFKPEVQAEIEQAILRLARGVAAAYDATAEVSFLHCYPPTINTPAETAVCQEAARDVLGAENVDDQALPSMAAEDFAFMLREKPGCYVWLGNGSSAGECALHNPRYDFNDDILPVGMRYWVRLVERLLG
ncbi:MAG: amidohydrolase [Zoogloeaceae bacterium]|jgi:hippurate hydrolase|nr:amidohydrolase [Zoogloeaceae bacterium]